MPAISGRWTSSTPPPGLKGLVLAEVELEAEETDPALPDWLGTEVTEDPRYSNAALAALLAVPG